MRAAQTHLLELLGVICGGVHGVHAGSQLRGQTLLERAQDAAVEVQGQQGVQDLVWLLLEDQAWVQGLGGNGCLLTLHDELSATGCELEDLVVSGVHAATVHGAELASGGHGQQGLDGGVSCDERDELGVDELDLVDLGGDEGGEHLVGDGLGLAGGGGLAQAE